MSRLKHELSWLRKKGAVKTSQDDAPQKSCGRCQTSFGLLINRGAICPSCRQRVCKQCREETLPGKEWVCIVCRKQIEIQLTTGEWLNEFQRPKRKEKTEPQKIPKRQKVKRSWTISSPFQSKDEDKRWRESQSVPSKPPRKKSSQDENTPASDRSSPERPPRRYSMSSIDGMPYRARSPAKEKQIASYENKVKDNKPPQYYFFGNENRYSPERRSSTLPRQPRKTIDVKREQYDDSTRFHSMPRTKTKPLQESRRDSLVRVSASVKSGLVNNVAKTPIVSSVMNEPSPAFRKRMLPQDPRESRPVNRRLPEIPVKRPASLPVDSPPPKVTPEETRRSKSREEEARNRPAEHRQKLPRSNTSITSGYATTGRPTKQSGSKAPVRRTQSFQSGTKPSYSSSYGESFQEGPRGNVAKFVLELERGIQRTCSNLSRDRVSGHSFSDKRDHSSDSFQPEPKRFHQDTQDNSSRRGSSHNSDKSIKLETTRITPEGDDYKIVFISSDSSKDSGTNTSIDSDSTSPPVQRPSKPLYENTNFHKKTPKGIDVGLMTEMDYFSDSDSSMEYPTDVYSIMSTSRRSISSLSDFTDAQEGLVPVSSLNQDQMKKIMQQTKTVEQEAQALQQALMGVFDPEKQTFLPDMLFRQNQPAFVPSDYSKPKDDFDNPIYENISRNNSVSKSKKSKCDAFTQTDFSPLSSDTDESYASSDETAVKYDYKSPHFYNKPRSVLDNKKTALAKSAYTSTQTPPNPPTICPPKTHLQITSERPKASVLLSPVRDTGVLSALFGKEQCVRAPRVIYHNVIKYCEDKNVSSGSLDSTANKCNSKSFSRENSPGCDTQTKSATSEPIKTFNSLVKNVPILKSETIFASPMASEISTDVPGDVNAPNKVISESVAMNAASGSSNEDTDDEVHVSRSYDVSPSNQGSSKGPHRVAIPSDSDPGSSESCSETDDEKSVCGEYVVTAVQDSDKLSSDENEETKADLPECDQAIDTIRPHYGPRNSEVDPHITTSDTENAESVIENKSETESTIGIDNDDTSRLLVDSLTSPSPVVPIDEKEDNDHRNGSSIESSIAEIESKDHVTDSSQIMPENELNACLETVESAEAIDPLESDPGVDASLENPAEDQGPQVHEGATEEPQNNSNECSSTQITGSSEVEQAVNCDVQPVQQETVSASDDLSAFSCESSDKSEFCDANISFNEKNGAQSTSNSELEVCDETIVDSSSLKERPIGESECLEKALSDIKNIDQNGEPPALPNEVDVSMETSSGQPISSGLESDKKDHLVPSECKTSDSVDFNDSDNLEVIKSVDKVSESVESDSSSSSDSALQGYGSESQCSEGSEEGNLISIVSVGDPTPKKASQGKVYICSDSTDSDVQVRPTCIVVTGSSGIESDGETESESSVRLDERDVTVLGVSRSKNNVMSMRVTSPESSRSASPTRGKSNDLQSILSSQDIKQQYRSGTDSESSGLATYFTVTLGSETPTGHKRTAKTPEVRRRSIPDRGDRSGSHSSTPTLGDTPSPTPSPAITPTPEPLEADIEENTNGSFSAEDVQEESIFDEFYDDEENQFDSFYDGHAMPPEESDATFDSIEDGEANFSETSSEDGYERDEEIRYCKRAYNFTLHTILEESCEESDYDKKAVEDQSNDHDPSELDKYFLFGLGNGPAEKKYANEESEYSDTFSETSSSVFSEGLESIDNPKEDEEAELASSRLEQYFQGFIRQPSIRSVGEESEIHTDESGSVGSDSEGSPSPEQPRKKLFRSRNVRSVSSSRSHGYSSDKGEGMLSDGSHHSGEADENDKNMISGEDEGSTESEQIAFDKSDGQFDTIKRRKKKKNNVDSPDKKCDTDKMEAKLFGLEKEHEDDRSKRCDNSPSKDQSSRRSAEESAKSEGVRDTASSPHSKGFVGSDLAERKYQSRDSGFIGSSDDLLKDKPEDNKTEDCTIEANSQCRTDQTNSKSKEDEQSVKSKVKDGKVSRSSTGSSADLQMYASHKDSHASNLSRKDSFNNWSSDEETNVMMSKMRMFFKNMFSHTNKDSSKGQKIKSPQLMIFEARLTNLMRTVPGINDDQVKEIVEYLSSEETWSDSYDSSDYTSSDLEGAYARLGQGMPELQSELQKQISVSCQKIIENFDQGLEPGDHDSQHLIFGRKAPSESSEDTSPGSKDTAFMYQKIMSSISHMKPDSDRGSIGSGSQGTSPPLLAKVMHHVGNRIVALMHEVSVSSENGDDVDSFNGGNLSTSSPRPKLFLPKKYKGSDSVSLDSSIDKSSLNSTSFESEDSPTDTEQSPESENGTPKILRHGRLSIISEKSSNEELRESHPKSLLSQESSRYSYKPDNPHSYSSQRSLEERSSHSYHDRAKDYEPRYLGHEDMRFSSREHQSGSKFTRSRRPETRKAKSHMSLEKIHQEDVKNTGERSESLGDLNILDRGRSSGFSSSYEQLDSDSTLKASDSYDRHIGSSSSSNIRLNASSRGSLTTSSRGSLAASSRGSLNAGSKGSLQGSSGPDDEEEKKSKKLSFFRYTRRTSMNDDKENVSREVRSTTLPRSNPIQLMSTGTLPRSQAASAPFPKSPSPLFSSASLYHSERPNTTAPRSARYHPPGYRAPVTTAPKRTVSTPTLRKDRPWHTSDDTAGSNDDHSTSMSAGSHHHPSGSFRGGVTSSESSRAASPLGGSLGRTSGGSLTSFDNDEDGKRRRGSNRRNASLSALGPKSRSDSMASVYSTGADGRYGSVTINGELLVALQYNYKDGQLECHIIQARDLAAIDTKRNRSDPYVKAYLLPDRSKLGKRKTKVKKHTLNPTFDEVLKFSTTLNDLSNRTLWVSVWNSDYFSRNDFLGEILIPLSDHVLEDSHPKWYTLQDKIDTVEESNYGAVLIVALKFVPPDSLALAGITTGSWRTRRSRGALQVRIKEASGLVGIKQPQNPPDPVCKGVLLPEKGKSSKQKTGVCRKTSNPQWNHTMVFGDVTLQELTDRGLELTIWDHDRFSGSEFLGGCRLNLGPSKPGDFMDASGLEQKLWEQMIERPNLWVESSILLRACMDRPKYASTYMD